MLYPERDSLTLVILMRLGVLLLILIVGLLTLAFTAPEGKRRGLQDAEPAAEQRETPAPATEPASE